MRNKSIQNANIQTVKKCRERMTDRQPHFRESVYLKVKCIKSICVFSSVPFNNASAITAPILCIGAERCGT